MRDLGVLQLLSSGYDHMMPLLDEMPPGIRPATGRGVHREVAAELAVTVLLALCRGLDRYVAQQARERRLPESHSTMVGKRAPVIGCGAVGSAVAARPDAFRCEPVLVDRTARTTPVGPVHGVAQLPTPPPTTDAVVLCAPLTDRTRGMCEADAPAKLNDATVLVNIARGELLDAHAVVRELRAGRLRVALDVTDPEPLTPGHLLRNLPGVLITPHVSAFTDTFSTKTVDFLRRQPHRYERGEEPHNVIVTTTGAETRERAA
ncbi:NAD(P)-dependent oxidoreductase [Streptomyces sp. NPDC088560]|uniref:NAD(P)-dependent oxidoreductase n=1 Tax=Streptomyces sp. NPDC088560 TaxID=3365868 RepID=UPI00382BF55F